MTFLSLTHDKELSISNINVSTYIIAVMFVCGIDARHNFVRFCLSCLVTVRLDPLTLNKYSKFILLAICKIFVYKMLTSLNNFFLILYM